MKKVLSCILMAIVALSFVACGGSKSSNNASKIVGTWAYVDYDETDLIIFNSDNTAKSGRLDNGSTEPIYEAGSVFYKYNEETNVLEIYEDGGRDFNSVTLRWENDNCFYIVNHVYKSGFGPYVRQ